MRPVAFRRLLRRNRIVLAVYMLGNKGGLLCHDTNIEITKAAGLSPALTREALETLVRDKVITILGPRAGPPGLPHRSIARIHLEPSGLPGRGGNRLGN